MPHKNPKIDKQEKDFFAHVKVSGKKHHGRKATINRDVLISAGEVLINNTLELLSDPVSLKEAVEHTRASLTAIVDAIEAES